MILILIISFQKKKTYYSINFSYRFLMGLISSRPVTEPRGPLTDAVRGPRGLVTGRCLIKNIIVKT